MDEHQKVRCALVACLRDGREIRRITGSQTAPHRRFARLQQMKKGAVAPILRGLAFIGSAIVHRFGRLGHIRAPAESAALIDRVKGVQDNKGARQRYPGLGDTPAEPRHQLGFAAADKPGLGHPAGELAEGGLVHIESLHGARLRRSR